MQRYLFCVAEHTFSIKAEENIPEALPNLKPFITESEENMLFNITIDNSISPAWNGNKVGTFPCPSATFDIYKSTEDAYQILISNENNIPCAFIQSDAERKNFTLTTRGTMSEQEFGINNALMIIYTMCSAAHKTLLIHASIVENNNRAYIFLGASGRGKSTHSDLWTKHIAGSRLINDDNPVVRIATDGTPTIYGSPWSGKRPIYMNVHYPIGGMTAIEQEKENRIEKENIPTSFGIMLSSCSTFKFDKKIHMNICGTITNILERIPVHTLYCRPDEEAAKLSSSTFGV